mmetsp:Transcript_8369/g.22700  ORF Transcript_8369/g.22700 Transcript_8369/m.22700 type:complete len:458 (-) Transcript_8369:186-1559(-)|eukprot:CAMPEP_0171190234 /NCGR_PEP_ID=MMETSP0790-20130122/18753_1 /TAXON_ID=2925 /ORGANISM="Alexandrium catenella, Strain OF101" /LENGTH=457 /DNA_ID=CAMNT_0011655363 /DNA_START=46 /DNA_END=1419 /DNA_ORIENTATION=-
MSAVVSVDARSAGPPASWRFSPRGNAVTVVAASPRHDHLPEEMSAAAWARGEEDRRRPRVAHSTREFRVRDEEAMCCRQSDELEALRSSLGVMCLRTERLRFENARLNQENAALRGCLAMSEQRAAEALAARREQAIHLPEAARRFPSAYIWEDACEQDSPASSLPPAWERRALDSPPTPPLRRPLPRVPRSWLMEDSAGVQPAPERVEVVACEPGNKCSSGDDILSATSREGVTCEHGSKCSTSDNLPPATSREGGKAAKMVMHDGILCDVEQEPTQPSSSVQPFGGSLRDITNQRADGGIVAWARASAAVPRSEGRERSSCSVARAISASGLRAASPAANTAENRSALRVMPKASPARLASSSSFVPPASSSRDSSGSFAPPVRQQASERTTPRPVLLGNPSVRSSPAKKAEAARPQTAQSSSRARAQNGPAPLPPTRTATAKRQATATTRQPWA